MDFAEVLDKVLVLLQQQGRVSYRALKLRFQLDDEFLAGLKEELLFAHADRVKEEGPGLVWTGAAVGQESENRRIGEPEQRPTTSPPSLQTLDAAAERRQLTVMFCDLVGSTALSAQLDPEDYRAVVRWYQQTSAACIARYEGHIAQHLGDGLLVYFGYPQAHEDDARRAVRAGLEIIEALRDQEKHPALQVRLGIHTGLVVVGEIGSSEKREMLALGETPNLAARIQGLAEPTTVLISAATQRLVGGQFECQPFGSHLVKGIDTPIAVYHVQGERQNVTPRTAHTTPLVGREQEVGLLRERWEQVKEGRGQVVLLSGEPGIGKSRLTQTLMEHVEAEGSLALEARCSPYHQNSAFYPLIDALQRALLFQRDDTAETKVDKLERALSLYTMPETLPLFAALLALPLPATAPPLNLTPQKQKERTIQALVQWWLTQAERQATVAVWEDIHWADPSTLEFLTLLLEQAPTSRLLVLLTARPEFVSPWPPRSHFVTLTLNRLGRRQTEAMITEVAGAATLPAEVVQQILAKTDGVPLFVEELTKTVLESVASIGSIESQGSKALQTIPIPATLQDSLMARLDRLNTAKELAQLGATLGREFSYELLQAISPLAEDALQQDLRQLVETELVYQRGMPPQAQYTFKHALIQDAAYQSLLKSRRHQLHQQIAHVLEERFPETKETQPELLAHHYTEAGLIKQAMLYWQQAGQRAVQRSANQEAISHLTKGLELLKTLPDTRERTQQELTLQVALSTPLQATKGYAAPELEATYNRARELCRQVGETPQLLPILLGLANFYNGRGEYQTAYELGEQLRAVTQRVQDSSFLSEVHYMLGQILWPLGEFVSAKEHAEQGIACYDSQQRPSHALLYGLDPGVVCLSLAAITLWTLGYPDQALKRTADALTLCQELSHPFSLSFALTLVTAVHQCRREGQLTQQWADTALTLAGEQGFALWSAWALLRRGWSLTEQGHGEEGIPQMHQGLSALRTMEIQFARAWCLAIVAEAHGKIGQAEEGLALVAEALEIVNKTGERMWEAELYRLKGELLLAQAGKR